MLLGSQTARSLKVQYVYIRGHINVMHIQSLSTLRLKLNEFKFGSS
jgi:hypothetical protein